MTRTYSEVSLPKGDDELAEYELTQDEWLNIQESCRVNLPDADDGCEHNATKLAELVVLDFGRDDWLDDETHPLWDLAAHFCTAADSS